MIRCMIEVIWHQQMGPVFEAAGISKNDAAKALVLPEQQRTIPVKCLSHILQ